VDPKYLQFQSTQIEVAISRNAINVTPANRSKQQTKPPMAVNRMELSCVTLVPSAPLSNMDLVQSVEDVPLKNAEQLRIRINREVLLRCVFNFGIR